MSSLVLDADLAALAEVRDKARKARAAFDAFAGANQEQLDDILRAMARAGTAAAEELARLAVDETGYGVYEHKILKNRYNTTFVARYMLGQRAIGVLWVDEANRMTSVTLGSGGIEYFGYAPDNKRVYRMTPQGAEEFTLMRAPLTNHGWSPLDCPAIAPARHDTRLVRCDVLADHLLLSVRRDGAQLLVVTDHAGGNPRQIQPSLTAGSIRVAHASCRGIPRPVPTATIRSSLTVSDDAIVFRRSIVAILAL